MANLFRWAKLSGKGVLGDNALPVGKHVYDYVVTDSNMEKKFTRDLDASQEVCVYAKLPRGFFILTPVGNYNPDWAIVFAENKVKHVHFIDAVKNFWVLFFCPYRRPVFLFFPKVWLKEN